MKKKFVAIMMVAAMAASMAACGSDGGSSDTQKGGSSTTTSDVANKDKPLVWFNRQPSNSSTGELDFLRHLSIFLLLYLDPIFSLILT